MVLTRGDREVAEPGLSAGNVEREIPGFASKARRTAVPAGLDR
jgi:hypothetical protein